VQADVYHLLDGSFGYMVSGIPWARTLVTVHDVIPALQARGQFSVPRPGWAARRLIASGLRVVSKAGAVCAVSQASANDVAALTGRQVDAIIPLYLRDFPAVDASRPARRSAGSFVLHVGNSGFYKNRLGVVRIFAKLARARPALGLVFAGAAPDETLRQEIRAQKLADRVEFEITPDDARLADLYSEAALLLFPSLYEGFGWPPLEAMHFGCPVVCSEAGSLPEVTGAAALRCAPHDIEGFAAAVSRILDDRDLAGELVARGYRNLRRFSAERMASGLIACYERLAADEGCRM
jgi:glycosyltransferase involved in cell wall biosynthesis